MQLKLSLTNGNNMKLIKYFSIAIALWAVILFLTQNKSDYQILSGETMGTTYNIKIRSNKNDNMLHNRVKQKLIEINQTMSVFEKDSEVNRINDAPADEWIELSDEMASILKAAHAIYKKTDGAFDPTIGKLVDIWGFGIVKTEKIPLQEEIDEVLSYSGFNRIKFSSDYKKLKKDDGRTHLNLSAIAKGYGVDEIAKLLENEGYKNFLVEIGGEISAKGNRAKSESGWNIGIMDPTNNAQNIAVATLKNSAVATSGDYFNYIHTDDAVYSHTISMKDGRPVRSNLTSVTVFGDNCRDADGYATSFMVMGAKKALAFANRHNLEAIFFVKDESGKINAEASNKAKKILGQ